jgi:hypothetical protein
MTSKKSEATSPVAEVEGRFDCGVRDAPLRGKAASTRIFPPVGKAENQCGNL